MSSRKLLAVAGWWSLLMLLIAAHGCGGASANGGNSESHFLHCTSDTDCTAGDRCISGQCRSTGMNDGGGPHVDGGPYVDGGPHVDEGGADGSVRCPADFPSFDKTCGTADDCALALHQTDCCGTMSVLAIAKAGAARFARTETACVSQYGPCGCHPTPAQLDDGTTLQHASEDVSQATVECVQSKCRTKANGSTFPCGDKSCGAGQYCLVIGSATPGFDCVTAPSCATDCSPCMIPGCSCQVGAGPATIGCPALAPNGTSCDALSSAAAGAIGDIFRLKSKDLGCTSDADCVIANGGSNCTSSCGGQVVSTSTAQMIQVAIDRVNADVCKAFVDQGCTLIQPPCPAPPSRAACVDGQCTRFPPANWVSFALDEGRGADSTYSQTPASCTTGHDCTLWKVTPDGSIAKSTSGVPSSAKLSSADFATLDGILRSRSFRQSFVDQSPVCEAAPTGIRVSYDLENQFFIQGFDVTGCALVGPAGNDIMRLYDLLRAY